MSKSLGNFFTIREVMERYLPEVIRFFILSSHYRSPLNYSDGHLDESRAGLTRLYTSIRDIDPGEGELDPGYRERFEQVMDDDFNTRAAVTLFHEIAGDINRLEDKASEHGARLARTLAQLGDVLGVMQMAPGEFLHAAAGDGDISPEDINRLIEERAQAKAAKDYAEADRIRERLTGQGIILEDGPGGTTWRWK